MKNYGIDRDNATILAMLRWPTQPSYREMAKLLKISLMQVQWRIGWLEQEGYLERHKPRRARCLILTEKGKSVYPEFVVVKR